MTDAGGHHGTTARVRTAFGVVVAVLLCAVPASTAGAATRPRAWIALSTQQTSVGTSVIVTLEGWDTRVALVSVCGNDARRGSRDCALTTAKTVSVGPDGRGITDFAITAPPIGCPCAIRVADAFGERTVRTVPIVIEGFPETTAALVDTLRTDGLSVKARILSDEQSGRGWWPSAVGGPARRVLELTVSNRGDAELVGLRIAAAVGRDRRSGEVAAARPVAALAPGEQRRIPIPIELPAPSHGEYVVFGTVSNPNGAKASFAAATSTEPWALWLLLPIVLLVTARVLRRRERGRVSVPEAQPAPAPRPTTRAPLSQSSPDVGAPTNERWGSPSYPSTVPDSPSVAAEAPVPVSA